MKRVLLILSVCLLTLSLSAHEAETASDATHKPTISKDSVYQGTFVKLDIFNPIYSLARSKGKLAEAEASVSVRLIDRLYPTIECGMLYGGEATDTTSYLGSGGFGRIGLDINPLKKSRKSPHAFLVGVRIGTSYQDYRMTETESRTGRWDTWGEVAAGCQVKMISGFYMGWTGRLKVLFTLNQKTTATLPSYIPGFGKPDTMGWGIDYYLGWRF